jgi:hypothetical protein
MLHSYHHFPRHLDFLEAGTKIPDSGTFWRRRDHCMFILPVLGCLLTVLVGWTEWYIDPHQSGIFPKLSLIGMSLTSATVLVLIAFAVYAEAFGVTSSVHYELLVRIYKSLAPLCVLGFLFGLVGVWRRSALRWYAPACAFFTACLWLVGALMIDPI